MTENVAVVQNILETLKSTVVNAYGEGIANLVFEGTAKLQKRYKCNNCEESSPDPAGALYECPSCGAEFNVDNANNGVDQCPNCFSTGNKLADDSCPQCGEGEVTPVWGLVCSCHDEFHLVNQEEE